MASDQVAADKGDTFKEFARRVKALRSDSEQGREVRAARMEFLRRLPRV